MSLTRKSAEVFLADGPISAIGDTDIELLREAARSAPRRRARINAHPDNKDGLHEMFIAIDRDSYIRPHKHPGKSEAFHIVDGAVDIVVFNDDGDIVRVVPLAARGAPGTFYYRMSEPFFHTLIIHSDQLIVHEITNGPFNPEGTVFADFAPPDADAGAVAAYRGELERRAAKFRENSR